VGVVKIVDQLPRPEIAHSTKKLPSAAGNKIFPCSFSRSRVKQVDLIPGVLG